MSWTTANAAKQVLFQFFPFLSYLRRNRLFIPVLLKKLLSSDLPSTKQVFFHSRPRQFANKIKYSIFIGCIKTNKKDVAKNVHTQTHKPICEFKLMEYSFYIYYLHWVGCGFKYVHTIFREHSYGKLCMFINYKQSINLSRVNLGCASWTYTHIYARFLKICLPNRFLSVSFYTKIRFNETFDTNEC